MSNEARRVIGEIIDHFIASGETPGDWWAPSEDRSSFGLDCQTKDGSKFWLDMDKDGTLTIFWKPFGKERTVVKFTA